MFLAVQAVDDRSWLPLILIVALLVYVWFAWRQQKTIREGITKNEEAWKKAIADSMLMQKQQLDELNAIRNLLEKRN